MHSLSLGWKSVAVLSVGQHLEKIVSLFQTWFLLSKGDESLWILRLEGSFPWLGLDSLPWGVTSVGLADSEVPMLSGSRSHSLLPFGAPSSIERSCSGKLLSRLLTQQLRECSSQGGQLKTRRALGQCVGGTQWAQGQYQGQGQLLNLVVASSKVSSFEMTWE